MIGFLGGTGPEGRGLALRLALAGERVMLGSRDLAKARQAAERVKAKAPSAQVLAAENAQVAAQADIVFVVVPYEAQAAVLKPLAEVLARKVVVSAVAPVVFAQGRFAAVPVPEGSAAAQAQRLLPRSQVVAAFHHVSAVDLWVPDRVVEGDVVACSDYQAGKERVMALVRRIPNLRPVDGDGLENARYVEEVTALLLSINRLHNARTMIKIVGLS
ncbi:MAG: NADPH-dependent F420 reductase [Chloroflexi bacterium]|nr:NADPH-dependent F420 reductase [Chloroflexota bacterium]